MDSISIIGASEVVDMVDELPTTSALTHLGKARPKRPKKHAPTMGQVMARPNEESRFDEEMGKFYTSSSNSEDFDSGSVAFLRPGCVLTTLEQLEVVNVEDSFLSSKDANLKVWFTFWKDFWQQLVNNPLSKFW